MTDRLEKRSVLATVGAVRERGREGGQGRWIERQEEEGVEEHIALWREAEGVGFCSHVMWLGHVGADGNRASGRWRGWEEEGVWGGCILTNTVVYHGFRDTHREGLSGLLSPINFLLSHILPTSWRSRGFVSFFRFFFKYPG